ncbi:class I SAM-dependent methyltransferase [Thermodesulfobacteriota bacterium]
MGYFVDHLDAIDQKKEELKGHQILSVLFSAIGEEKLRSYAGLHVGCTEGTITYYLSKHLKSIIGVDIDEQSIEYARENYSSDNSTFERQDATKLSLQSESFDLIICNHSYNYVDNVEMLISEIWRVLKFHGYCYFAATRLGKDPAGYLTRNLSYWGLRKLVRLFELEDYTIEVLKKPTEYNLHMNNIYTQIGKRIYFILKPLIFMLPSYIWVLKKTVVSK